MQCREFEERLQFAVDSRRDPSQAAELDAHAAVCADCSAKREWFSALARMTEAFGASPARAAAADYDRGRLIRKTLPLVAVEDPVVVDHPVVADEHAVVLATPVERAPRRSRWLLAGSGLAVAAGVALFVTLAFLPWSPPAESDEVAVTTSTTQVVEDASHPDDNPGVATPGPGVVAAVSVDGHVRPLSLERLRASLTSSLPSEPPVTGSLRPIATSFGVAWETVRSALPNGRSDAGPGQDQADASRFHAIVTA